MNNVALYRALIEAGASEESATRAAEDVEGVMQVPQHSQLATKVELAKQETRLMIWIAGIIMFLIAGVTVAGLVLSSQGMAPLAWMLSVLLFIVGIIIFVSS